VVGQTRQYSLYCLLPGRLINVLAELIV